jgi:hypothetical protein
MASIIALAFGAVTLLSGRAAYDESALPSKLPINLDGSYTAWVGRTADGAQFFSANAFVQAGATRRYFATFYLFDADGTLKSAKIDEIPEGTDKATAIAALEKVKALREQNLKALVEVGGAVKPGNIVVRPFEVLHDGISFGLIGATKPTRVVLQPGTMLTFRPPWDGSYGR